MPLVGRAYDSGFPVDKPNNRITDLARVALDLSWATERSETGGSSSRPSPYPSPPMSGSPHTLHKATSEASDLALIPGNYSSTVPQDAYAGYSTQSSPTDSRSSQGYPGAPDLYSRSYPSDALERMNYGYPHPSDRSNRPPSYHPQGQSLPSISQGAPQTLPYPQPSPSPQLIGSRPSTVESQPGASPKSQRKAKGHVASACVPCKKAHLRCDSQRPCSRCISNGKEDSCHDVVHKKRGRPRLRDDREARYDLSRPPPPHDNAFRRSTNSYPTSNASGSGYDSFMQHQHQPVRELHPHPGEYHGPRHMDRSYYPEEDVYGRPMVNSRPQEPVAYLTMDLEFSRVSDTFNDAIGGLGPRRTLEDTVAIGEREKVKILRNELSTEQKRREPNYLPPILGRGEQVLQTLGFSVDDFGKFHLRYSEYLTFVAVDGQTRVFPVQIGLAKEGSFYFVVAVLGMGNRPQQPPLDRSAPLAYSPHGPPAYPAYPQQNRPTSVGHNRLSQHSPPLRQLPAAPQSLPLHNRGMSHPSGSSYSPFSNRHEYQGGPQHHTPRSQRPPAPQSHTPTYQLPPIRSPMERQAPPRDQDWYQREERTSRVDIGGLIEKPEGPGRMH
ncbi:unnamed protein product [Clonostachys rosea]|uniref:Zn(2)-C6 fungal-type domain-containing protein n=1 Tax=Bionectria ochroleuca TaxID=29856 RepID=A0ABY6U186_BIOOC|nr:unnamed protein product [Clonostachys rosea]